MDFLDRLLAQVNTLHALWPSFLVVWALTGLAIWRIMEWRYRAVIDGQDHRLKLRDDTIAYLERSAIQGPSGAAREPGEGTAPVPAAIDSDPRIENPRLVEVHLEDRIYIENKSAVELMAMLDGHNSMKEAALAKPFIGKWIEVSLPVVNIVPRDDETLVMFSRPDAYISQIWMHFPRDRDRLEILDTGDMLTASGRIYELSSLVMRLYDCEMIRAS